MIALSVRRLAGTLLVFAFISLAAPRLCLGHGGVSIENDMCKLRAGPYVMHFTGYQPYSAPELEFCEDIPRTGLTLIVLDYLDSALRDLPVAARIIRDTGDESDLERITVYHKPAAVYPRGSFVIEHTFTEPGQFVGLVTVGDQVSRFPFAVGTRGWRTMVLYTFFAIAALGIGGLLFLYASRRA
ncbi:MAG: hypothetical protein ACRERD_25150 [Candidatus Binatia bacterium]